MGRGVCAVQEGGARREGELPDTTTGTTRGGKVTTPREVRMKRSPVRIPSRGVCDEIRVPIHDFWGVP